MTRDEFIAFGRWNPKNPYEQFNMALLALRTTSSANGVSRLHGEVSRRMWQANWPNVPLAEVPIESVTNGIHTRSWLSAEMSALFLRYLGPNWLRKPADQTVWNGVERIPDVELWRIHERRRERLVAYTRSRLVDQLRRRGASAKEIEAAYEVLSPDALTIGFARRFATYKRATLLLRDPDRLRRLLTNESRPVQFIFAGKAHPRDNQGKDLIKQLVHFGRLESVRRSFVFLEDYDMNVARYLVQGVDVWLNTPQRPLEASGTSGMKVVPNGGLNLSVLDGWWNEGYDPDVGWAIGAGEEYNDPGYRDEVEGKSLFDVLENDLVPLFYELGSDRLPRKWIAKVKSSMKRLAPVFNTNRMVQEYAERFYLPALERWRKLSAGEFARVHESVRWKQWVRTNWHEVQILRAKVESTEVQAGGALRIEADIFLGQLHQTDVVVQIYSGPLDADYNITEGTARTMQFIDRPEEGTYRYEGAIPCQESGLFGYLVRVLPHHPDLNGHFGLEMMRWIGEGEKVPVAAPA
jgi:starch phosphorylase